MVQGGPTGRDAVPDFRKSLGIPPVRIPSETASRRLGGLTSESGPFKNRNGSFLKFPLGPHNLSLENNLVLTGVPRPD